MKRATNCCTGDCLQGRECPMRVADVPEQPSLLVRFLDCGKCLLIAAVAMGGVGAWLHVRWGLW